MARTVSQNKDTVIRFRAPLELKERATKKAAAVPPYGMELSVIVRTLLERWVESPDPWPPTPVYMDADFVIEKPGKKARKPKT